MTSNINLNNLAINQGFSVKNSRVGWYSGASVSGLGDINNDGYADVIVGSPGKSPSKGISYLIFGKANGFSNVNVDSLTISQGLSITGTKNYLRDGYLVSSAGDINKDGYSDVIIMERDANAGTSVSYVIFGKASGFSNINLASLTAPQGFSIATTGGCGAVSSAGDINKDGYSDIIISKCGTSYVIFGKASGFSNINVASLTAAQGFSINYGVSASGAGDVNGDGYDDIVIGSIGANNYAGQTYVIFGKASGFSNINVATLADAQGFSIYGNGNVSWSGYAVSGAGDMNGDGYDEIIIGAPYSYENNNDWTKSKGAAYVVFGKSSGFTSINLETLTIAQGFYITGTAATYPYTGYYVAKCGFAVSGAGDVNGDGYDDIIIGTPYGNYGAGVSHIIFGKASGFTNIDLTDITTDQGVAIFGNTQIVYSSDDLNTNNREGASVGGAGDFNGDGYADIIIGANGYSGIFGGSPDGTSYVVFGTNSAIQTSTTTTTPALASTTVIATTTSSATSSSVALTTTMTSSTIHSSVALLVTTTSPLGVISYTVGDVPVGIAVADINNDRKLDIVTTNFISDTVSALIGKGNGTFQSHVEYAVGNNPIRVALADFNNDGKLDIVSTNMGIGTVSVLLGSGDGTFNNQVSYTVGRGPIGVSVGDLNGDGKVDIVDTNQYDNTISVLLGNGDGTFQTQVFYAVGSIPYGVDLSDLNGDGKLDIVNTNQDDKTISVLLGKGDGGFYPQVTYAVGNSPSEILVKDVNGDNILDAVNTNSIDNTISVLLGNGDGTFNAQISYNAGNSPLGIKAADFNNDGKIDIVTNNADSNEVSVLLGQGDGTFQTRLNYSAGVDSDGLIEVGDFNDDGKLDIAISSSDSDTVYILLNNEDMPTITTSSTTLAVTSSTSATSDSATNFINNSKIDQNTDDATIMNSVIGGVSGFIGLCVVAVSGYLIFKKYHHTVVTEQTSNYLYYNGDSVWDNEEGLQIPGGEHKSGHFY